MDLLFPRPERIPEISMCELILAGTFSFLFTGFVSAVSLYGCFVPWPDRGPHPDILTRPFYLLLGLVFGFFFVRITQEIFVNVHRKVCRLINYVKSWISHSSEEQEDEQEEEEEEEEEEEGGGGCVICMEDLERGSGGGVVRLPDCLHRFHRDCIDRWLFVRPCCPTCRHLVAVGNN